MGEQPLSGASDYLAAERTFLAWIRTGLALMGFGFVVARFGLFLQELQVSQLHLKPQSYGLSPWFGAALIMLGVIVSLLSLWRHLRLVQALNRGGVAFRRPSSLAIVVALLLAAVGLAMAIYVVSTHAPNHANRERLPERTMASTLDHGIVRNTSQPSVDETVATLERILQAKEGKPSGAWHWQRTSTFGDMSTQPQEEMVMEDSHKHSINNAGQSASVGLIIRPQDPTNLETPFDQLDAFLTPTELFSIRSHFPTPQVDLASYHLRIDGAVRHSCALSYQALRDLPSKTRVTTLECAGNSRGFLIPQVAGAQWELGAVGKAAWTGVPLGALLERAGMEEDACEIVLEGADQGTPQAAPVPPGPISYARSVPRDNAMQREVLIAY